LCSYRISTPNELLDERRRRQEAEETLALLREKTKEKFFALKNENESLKRMITELSEQRSNDSEWLGLQESLRAIENERKALQDENENLKKQISDLNEPYDRQFHGIPKVTVSTDGSEKVWAILTTRVFRTEMESTFPQPLDLQVGILRKEISDLRTTVKQMEVELDTTRARAGISEAKATAAELRLAEAEAAAAAAAETADVARSASAERQGSMQILLDRKMQLPWSLEKERLERMIDQLEDSLEAEQRKSRDFADELTELRKRLRTHEENSSLISSDETKILYAKNVFSKLFSLAPQGCPEFEQLLLVLCAFFQVPVEDAAGERRLRLQAATSSRMPSLFSF
jgi:chromosome segregation ATPase